MELKDESLERALSNKSEDGRASRAENRCSISQEDETEDRDGGNIGVISVISEFIITEFEPEIPNQSQGTDDQAPDSEISKPRFVGYLIFFCLDIGVCREHSDPNDE